MPPYVPQESVAIIEEPCSIVEKSASLYQQQQQDECDAPSTAHQQRERAVSFADELEHVSSTLGREDYTAQEVEACWYTPREFLSIKEDVRCTALLIKCRQTSQFGTKNTLCRRGLECYTKNGAMLRRLWLASRSVVIGEQLLQREEGSNDPEFIAQIYMECSTGPKAAALAIGMRDQFEANLR
eukprot:Nitzschia sp. Nitz4//scaffold256_size27904//24746//25297//NITZ4_008173-RA/size27904-processed-gene-0.14-mRNA-1//-1//CDS//3329544423//3520//frame0